MPISREQIQTFITNNKNENVFQNRIAPGRIEIIRIAPIELGIYRLVHIDSEGVVVTNEIMNEFSAATYIWKKFDNIINF